MPNQGARYMNPEHGLNVTFISINALKNNKEGIIPRQCNCNKDRNIKVPACAFGLLALAIRLSLDTNTLATKTVMQIL